MLTRWYDIDRELAALDELHNRISHFFGDAWAAGPRRAGVLSAASRGPRASLHDQGEVLLARVLLPGLKEDNITVEVHGDVLSISGERHADQPEGYRVHRSERGSQKFSRTFGLPCRVDAERTSAKLSDGVLTVTMAKHAEARPKRITVAAS